MNDRTESEVNYLPERQGCQEKGIEPKILIEPLLHEKFDFPPIETEVYCFNGQPKIFVIVRYGLRREICYYDENFNNIDLLFHNDGKNLILKEKPIFLMKEILRLSKQLSKDFNFVRVDWLIFYKKIFFNELTFTPYSGFIRFDKKWNLKLGKWINLER